MGPEAFDVLPGELGPKEAGGDHRHDDHRLGSWIRRDLGCHLLQARPVPRSGRPCGH